MFADNLPNRLLYCEAFMLRETPCADTWHTVFAVLFSIVEYALGQNYGKI